MRRSLFVFAAILVAGFAAPGNASEPLRIATFQVDATPPLGSPLCNGAVAPAAEIVGSLTARGIVLLTAEEPIVLCAVDWVGISNGGQDAWRQALAQAAGTTMSRVAVHTLHQHDAPGCDFAADALLADRGLGGALFHVQFAKRTIQRTADALRQAIEQPTPVTHLATARAKVEKVASNRRILGPDGKVQYVRYSSSRIEEAIAAPEGTIDPYVRLVSFYNGEQPIVVSSYYATHPQSYYGQGGVNPDFVGMARAAREAAVPGVIHIHFNGAGGNVAAGKYNDGSPANRPILAGRLEAAMAAAWALNAKVPITAADVSWKTEPVALPLRERLLYDAQLRQTLDDKDAKLRDRLRAARDVSFAARVRSGHKIQLSCLRLGSVRVLHMPGELFVEYQLAAQDMRPDDMVCMAAYGDYGPGYIGTQIAYGQGGYETGIVSRVAPEVEGVLMDAMRKLLE